MDQVKYLPILVRSVCDMVGSSLLRHPHVVRGKDVVTIGSVGYVVNSDRLLDEWPELQLNG